MTGKDIINAVCDMYEDKVLDNIAKSKYCIIYKALGISRLQLMMERRHAKKLVEFLDMIVENGYEPREMSFFQLIHHIKGAEIYRNLLYYLIR